MPVQAPPWTDFLSCLICYNEFDCSVRRPISLGCGHTMCKSCLSKLQRKQCPFDQAIISTDVNLLPENYALLQLVGGRIPEKPPTIVPLSPSSGALNGVIQNSPLSRPMQRKLVTLINCQLVEEEGRARGMRAARSIGERTVTELILQHQNPQQLSANLWAAVRARGCQFLGPAMQEEVLKLVLLALEDGSALSRKVLVIASCFKVSKRDGDSSLMQLKEEFVYETLRREHDAQIVQIATEAGLRIAPEQWSSLLYGDTAHKSHMQSIIDKLQTPQSFALSVQELVIALQRTGDPGNLSNLRPYLELLAGIDPSPDASPPLWEDLKHAQEAAKIVVKGLVDFVQTLGIENCKKTE
ncbi:roquin-1 [Caerostris extrusa]|uniref:Roquin-1 n=1 Tax=Caerostris extrusa TaxID=172846 RepID=A0AAV4U4B2_CAEEX|nr:roquin-1 [Caerostris extrusa]